MLPARDARRLVTMSFASEYLCSSFQRWPAHRAKFFVVARSIVTPAITLCVLLPALAQERKDSQEHKDSRPTFGTTVFMPTGLMGQVYKISEFSTDLPRFKHGKPIATLYTDSLNITP